MIHLVSQFLTRIMLLIIIGASHPLHTHSISTSTLYIYKVFQFQHLLLWLVVIRMQFQPDICCLGPLPQVVLCVVVKAGFSVGCYDRDHTLNTPRRSS